MTAPMSLQPWWWQIFILIQRTSQFFKCLFMLRLGIDPEKLYRVPSYARTAYVVAIWPSFLFDSFVKIWATCEIFLGKWFTAPPWQKISRTPMMVYIGNYFRITRPRCLPYFLWLVKSFFKHSKSYMCGAILKDLKMGKVICIEIPVMN